MTALQRMLVQSEGRKILVLPAWPKVADVEFRLHAPYGTTVEGAVRPGKLVGLKVSPSRPACGRGTLAARSRWLRDHRRDVVVMGPK